jgi:hypothetical protein
LIIQLKDEPQDWTIRELAMYDLPALVEYVCDATGYDKASIDSQSYGFQTHRSSYLLCITFPCFFRYPKIAFIGHSQGNGIAFISLSVGMRPEIGQRLSCFIALAPAVYAGPLTHGFPFTTLSQIEWSRWKIIFGKL